LGRGVLEQKLRNLTPNGKRKGRTLEEREVLGPPQGFGSKTNKKKKTPHKHKHTTRSDGGWASLEIEG